MCGVPYHAAENYIARLIRAGHKVAICEQMEVPGPGKKIVRREVIRVLTPGTAGGAGLVDAKENNYLAAVARSARGGSCCRAAAGAGRPAARGAEAAIGLAFVDLSTGEFRATEFCGDKAEARLRDELGILRPREVLLARPATFFPVTCAGGDGWVGGRLRRGWTNGFSRRIMRRGCWKSIFAWRLWKDLDYGTCAGYGCGWGAGALFARDFGDRGADAGGFG